jgi:hypothetical protein
MDISCNHMSTSEQVPIILYHTITVVVFSVLLFISTVCFQILISCWHFCDMF